MQVHVTFLFVSAVLIASTEPKPAWSDFYASDYLSSALTAEPQLLQYQEAYSPYYLYNVHTDVKALSAGVLGSGKPGISIPTYNLYYGTPVYDFRFPLNPVYPVLRPSQPGLPPKPTAPPTTQRPSDKDEDESDEGGIEKLDSKMEPKEESKDDSKEGTMKPSESDESKENDSVVVDSI